LSSALFGRGIIQNLSAAAAGHPELLTTLVPGMFKTASPSFLETYFRVLPQKSGWKFTSDYTGEYDHWAA